MRPRAIWQASQKLIFIFDEKYNYIENTMGLVIAILNWLGLWVVCVQNSGESKLKRGIESPTINGHNLLLVDRQISIRSIDIFYL